MIGGKCSYKATYKIIFSKFKKKFFWLCKEVWGGGTWPHWPPVAGALWKNLKDFGLLDFEYISTAPLNKLT